MQIPTSIADMKNGPSYSHTSDFCINFGHGPIIENLFICSFNRNTIRIYPNLGYFNLTVSTTEICKADGLLLISFCLIHVATGPILKVLSLYLAF